MSCAVGAATGLFIGSVNLYAQDSQAQASSDSDQVLQRMMDRRRAELGGGDISAGEAGSSRLTLEQSAPGNSDLEQIRRRMMERRRAELGDEAVEPPLPKRGDGERGSQTGPGDFGRRDGFRGAPGARGGQP